MALRSLFGAAVLLGLLGCATASDELARDYYNLGVGYLDQGEYAQAQEYFGRALDLDADFTSASYNLARAYMLTGSSDQAVALLQDLLHTDPDNAMVRETLAYALGLSDEWDESVQIMRGVTDERELSARGWRNYAVALIQTEDYTAAYEAAQTALQLDDGMADARIMLVIAAARIPDRLPEHEEDLQTVLESTPDSREVTLALGEALEGAERYDAAIGLYERAARTHTEGGEVSFRHGELLILAAEEPQQGVAALAQAVSQGFEDQERLEELLEQVDVELPAEIREIMGAEEGTETEGAEETDGEDTPEQGGTEEPAAEESAGPASGDPTE